MALHAGDPAPDFALYDTTKNKVALSDYRGQPVILLFFPLAFTSVCTIELCSVRDNIGLYNSLHAKIFGISVDSLHTLAKYKEEQQLNFTLLSDFNKEVSTQYEALYSLFGYDMQGVSKRAAFVIDADGMIRYAEILENAGKIPDFSAIQSTLESLAASA